MIKYIRNRMEINGFFWVFEKVLLKINLVSVRRSFRSFNYAIKKNRWEEAIEKGELILKHSPNNIEVTKKLAFCYWSSGQHDTATLKLKQSLDKFVGNNLNEIINSIEGKLSSGKSAYISTYKYLGGLGNLGVIEHENKNSKRENKSYITKIVLYTGNSKLAYQKECLFYNKIRKEFLQLKDISPEMVSFINMKSLKISFMTFEKITGKHPEKDVSQGVVKTHHNLSCIMYKDLNSFFNSIDLKKQYMLSGLLHKKQVNKLLFLNLEKKVKKFPMTLKLLQELKNIIIGKKLYKKIVPEIYYSMCHNDFGKGNILLDKSDNFYVIDWANYGIGFKDFDLSTYFRSTNCSFFEIREHYLQNIDYNNEIEITRKMFFIYGYIIGCIQRLGHLNEEELNTKYIGPAVEYVQLLESKICQK